jgi:hypothetical protein
MYLCFFAVVYLTTLSVTHTLSPLPPLSLIYIYLCVCVVELGYDVGKGIEYSVSLLTSVLTAERNKNEFISATECLTLETGCRINRCRFNRVPLCVCVCVSNDWMIVNWKRGGRKHVCLILRHSSTI